MLLAAGETEVTGAIWGKQSVSNAILQPNDYWELKLSFIVSSPGSVTGAGLAVWLTTRDAILDPPGTHQKMRKLKILGKIFVSNSKARRCQAQFHWLWHCFRDDSHPPWAPGHASLWDILLKNLKNPIDMLNLG